MKVYFIILLLLLDSFIANLSFCALNHTLLLLLIGLWSQLQFYIDCAFWSSTLTEWCDFGFSKVDAAKFFDYRWLCRLECLYCSNYVLIKTHLSDLLVKDCTVYNCQVVDEKAPSFDDSCQGRLPDDRLLRRFILTYYHHSYRIVSRKIMASSICPRPISTVTQHWLSGSIEFGTDRFGDRSIPRAIALQPSITCCRSLTYYDWMTD